MSHTILGPLQQQGVPLPLFSHLVPAGFASPAADHLEKPISLDDLFEISAPHVYLVKTAGDSMIGAGIDRRSQSQGPAWRYRDCGIEQ